MHDARARPKVVGALVTALALGTPGCNVDAVIADDAGDSFGAGPEATGSTASSSGDESAWPTADTSNGDGTATTTALDDGPKLDVGVDTESAEIGCSDEAPRLIHVLLATIPAEIWSYDPVANAFDPFATVTCDEIHGLVTGFALERSGDVLLLSREPEDPDLLPDIPMQLTRFDPLAASCDVLYYGPIADQVDCADLAFVAMADDPQPERLFAHSCNGGNFGIVPDAGLLFHVEATAPTPFELLGVDDYNSVALAGTGDGRLYGVGGDLEAPDAGHIVEYDQNSGAMLSDVAVPDLDLGTHGALIALGFYAGDLYAFGGTPTAGPPTLDRIRRYDLDDDDANGIHDVTTVEVPPDAPGGVLAAASPTCIPLTPAG